MIISKRYIDSKPYIGIPQWGMFSNICRHKYKCLAVTLYSKNNAGAYDAGGDAGVARDADQRTKGEASSKGWGRK